jgi:DNA repair exonuclease SbcCD ATPase subunit
MLEFGLMKVEGFGPIRKEEFDWGISGLNIIQAPNGFGKTKFINALYWSLYGKTLSGSVETWEHLRDGSYMGTLVEINFMKGNDRVKVIRCKGYRGKVEGAKGGKRLIIKVNGVDSKIRDKKDTQKEFEKLIGYSSELFRNSIIFGQKLKRLITETGPNKKKVFDEAFEVTYIAKAKAIAEELRDNILIPYNDQVDLVNDLIKERKTIEDKLLREQEVVNSFEKNKQDNISRETAKVDLDKLSLAELDKELKDFKFKDLDEKEKRYNRKIDQLDKSLIKYGDLKKLTLTIAKGDFQDNIDQKDMKKLVVESEKLSQSLSKVPDICDRCNRLFNEKDKQKEKDRIITDIKSKQKEITELDTLIKSNQKVLSALKIDAASILNTTNQIDTLKTKLNALEDIKKDKAKIDGKISNLEEKIRSSNMSIEFFKSQVVKNKIDLYTRDLSSILEKLLNEKTQLRCLHKRLGIYNWLINEPLSNHGLKAYIFNIMLDKVNLKLEYYSQFIGFQAVFDIDMSSYNKDLITYIYNGDNIIPYDDLSGGQQQSVDVVSAFAIHDVVNEGRECNLLIMDEVFESLDKNNIEIVTELIQDKAQEKSIYLVTHLENFNPSSSNIIRLDFKNGFTRGS